MNALVIALLSSLTLLGATPGRPPSAEEERLFAEGQKSLQAGDAAGAERAWMAGFDVARDPAFLVRIGEAQERQNRPADAAATYQRYLQAAPDASDRAEIEGRIRRLTPAAPAAEQAGAAGTQPAPGTITAPAAPAAPLPSAAQAPATPAAPLPSAARAPAPVAQAGDTGSAPEDENRERPPLARRLLITGAVLAGVTAALLVTSAAYGAAASSKASDVDRLIGFVDGRTGLPKEYADVAAQYEDAVADGKRYERRALGFLIGAAASAAVSATLLGIGYGMGNKGAEPSVALAPGGASAGLTWRF